MKCFKNIKTVLTFIAIFILFAWTSQATIDGFTYTASGGSYTVPSGKILVLEQIAFSPATTSANANLIVNGITIPFPAATNGLYVLPKPLFLPAKTTVSANYANGPAIIFGVIIDTSDAPLFAGVNSSIQNVAVTNDMLTGIVQMSSTAPTKVIIQSSTNLVDWNYDSSVMVERSSDKTKTMFIAPISSSSGRFYRALVRRNCNT